MNKKASTTIRLSDTIDQFSRRVHINVLKGKVTMVYRWKARSGGKHHTQRMTLTDEQAGSLTGALTKALEVAAQGNDVRQSTFLNAMANTALF